MRPDCPNRIVQMFSMELLSRALTLVLFLIKFQPSRNHTTIRHPAHRTTLYMGIRCLQPTVRHLVTLFAVFFTLTTDSWSTMLSPGHASRMYPTQHQTYSLPQPADYCNEPTLPPETSTWNDPHHPSPVPVSVGHIGGDSHWRLSGTWSGRSGTQHHVISEGHDRGTSWQQFQNHSSTALHSHGVQSLQDHHVHVKHEAHTGSEAYTVSDAFESHANATSHNYDSKRSTPRPSTPHRGSPQTQRPSSRRSNENLKQTPPRQSVPHAERRQTGGMGAVPLGNSPHRFETG